MQKTTISLCLVLLFFVVLAALSQPTVRISAYPYVSLEPATVNITTRILLHDDNRELSVDCDGSNYYRGSAFQLDGSNPPSQFYFQLRDIPAGEYTCQVTLWRRGGHHYTASTSFTVN